MRKPRHSSFKGAFLWNDRIGIYDTGSHVTRIIEGTGESSLGKVSSVPMMPVNMSRIER